MNHFLTLSKNDFRITFRDPAFKGLLIFPFVAFGLIRLLLPWVVVQFPVVAQYGHVVLMWACMQTATMFGFIYGFLFLEEKDEQVDGVIRILPISTLRLLVSRLAMGYSISVFANFLILQFGGVAELSPVFSLLLALQYSLIAPLLALWLAAMASNKIEGMAQMKLGNLGLNVPILLYFLPYEALHASAFIPTYWSFRSLEMAIEGSDLFWVFLLGGGVVYSVFMWWLLNRLKPT